MSSVALFKLFIQLEIRQKILEKVSKYSLGLYLVHPLILEILKRINLFKEIDLVSFVLMGLITIIVSLLLSYFIMKIPYLKKVV
nr:acyltransferase family protein [Aquimarina agarivorans]